MDAAMKVYRSVLEFKMNAEFGHVSGLTHDLREVM